MTQSQEVLVIKRRLMQARHLVQQRIVLGKIWKVWRAQQVIQVVADLFGMIGFPQVGDKSSPSRAGGSHQTIVGPAGMHREVVSEMPSLLSAAASRLSAPQGGAGTERDTPGDR
jgi:hypothetical protein